MTGATTKKRSKKAGLPAGTLMHIGEQKMERATVKITVYEGENSREVELSDLERYCASKNSKEVVWVNVGGIHQADIVEMIGKVFHLHPLSLEDVMNTDQRPKMEEYENYLFVVLKMLVYDEPSSRIRDEQISLILGNSFLISFQEGKPDAFGSVREAIRSKRGRINETGVDYLAYSLIDTIVDNYFFTMETLGEDIEGLEDNLIKNPGAQTLRSIHRLKRELIFLRRTVWPLREVIGDLERRGSVFIQESTIIYLRDVYDHIIHVSDTIETFRDMVSGMLDIYLSSASNRMNEIMKVLTIIATIFIPLTWIVGIYGMNFEHMPELRMRLGYPFAMLFMVVVAILMLVYFKRKKWF
ncbi:MAG: Magnesium transport protein CorA [Syntrophorhabdus sp. PtaU1.Bin050]|nr:MAG: Magnesium transport protein CorA [Syntrophorhabdus sp. PtaU1.Bin050]